MEQKRREKIIERLIDDKVDTITQWAIIDVPSLREYISQAENFEKIAIDELERTYEIQFGKEFDE